MFKYFLHPTDPYYLSAGCKKGTSCSIGMSCVAENKCPNGCYFAECLHHARSVNADGFSFRNVDLTDPFCNICNRDQVKDLQHEQNSGVSKKKGKNGMYIYITQFN